jgi:lysophospholipase L1-like esterase
VRPGEVRLFLRVFLVLGLTIAGHTLLETARDALFLARLPPRLLALVYVVVALGTNGPITAEALDRLERAVGPDRQLVLVNAFAPRDWIDGVNTELATFDAAQPGVVVADWAGAAAAHADLLSGDGIHPGPTGGRLFAETVATAVQGVENARAQAAFDRSVRVSALASRLIDGDK